MSYGTCKICGCTDENACVIPGEENCHWVNEAHTFCSNCCTAFISVNGKLIATLEDKGDWENKMPDIRLQIAASDILMFVSRGEDLLSLSEKVIKDNQSYPMKVYKISKFDSVYSNEDLKEFTRY